MHTENLALGWAGAPKPSWSWMALSLSILGLIVPTFAGIDGSGDDSSKSHRSVFYVSDGPWGRLRCTKIHLEASRSVISGFAVPSPRPRWSFPEEVFDEVPRLLRDAGAPESFITKLLEPHLVVREGDFVHVFPPVAELINLAPESRLVIYTQLANYPINTYHYNPLLITEPSVEEFYSGGDLSAEMIRRIDKLTYRRGGTLLFSDVSALIHFCEDQREVQAVVRAMTRTQSLMIRIEVDDSTDVEGLIDYWTLGDGVRKKNVEPIIRSIIETRGLETLPLAQILPPLPRKLIYTFPGVELARSGLLPDCHWTSINFFNYEANDSLLDADLAASMIIDDCDKVEPPYAYGDILMFVNRQGRAKHSCVYLADNIVFTKNGRSALSPWVIMMLPEVEGIYNFRRDLIMQGYRIRSS